MGKPTSINPNPCFQHSTQIPLCIHFWKWRGKAPKQKTKNTLLFLPEGIWYNTCEISRGVIDYGH